MCVNNLPRVVTCREQAESRTCDLSIAISTLNYYIIPTPSLMTYSHLRLNCSRPDTFTLGLCELVSIGLLHFCFKHPQTSALSVVRTLPPASSYNRHSLLSVQHLMDWSQWFPASQHPDRLHNHYSDLHVGPAAICQKRSVHPLFKRHLKSYCNNLVS